jgi:hypothetical protein
MCPEHERLHEDKKKASALWISMRDSTRARKKTLDEIEEGAVNAFNQWKEHRDHCPECKQDPNYQRWFNETP